MSEAIPVPEAPAAEAVETTTTEQAASEPQFVALPFEKMREGLPPELRDSPSLKGIDSFESLVQQHANVQHLIGGEKIARPKEDAPQEDWDRFYNTLGRPDAPDKYDLGDFQPPEGLPWDGDLQSGMLQDLHVAGLTNEQVNKVVRSFAARQHEGFKNVQTSIQEAHDKADRELKTEWGNAYDGRIQESIKGMRYAFGELADDVAQTVLTDGSLLGDNPVFIRAFQKIGASMGEHQMIGDRTPGDPAVSPAQAAQEIKALESDPEFQAIFTDKSRHNDPRFIRWNTLMDIANPG